MPRNGGATSSTRVRKFGHAVRCELWFVGVDPGEEAVEVCAAECPVERSRDLPVVVAEAEQPFGERVEGWSSPALVDISQCPGFGGAPHDLALVAPGTSG